MRDIECILADMIPRFHARQINCAESVLLIMAEYYGWQHGAAIPRIATAFGGGMAGTQCQCGALTGGLMAIGLLRGREVGGDKAPAYEAGKELIAWFEGEVGTQLCRDIVGCDLSDPAQNEAFSAPGGGHETVCEPLVAKVCRHLAARYPNG